MLYVQKECIMITFIRRTTFILLLLGLSAIAKAQFISARLSVAGLTCSMCCNAVYNSLSKLSFIEKIDVDISHAVFTLQFQPNAKVSPDKIRNAVELSGFSLASLKMKAVLNNNVIREDSEIVLGDLHLHFLNVSNQKLQGSFELTFLDKGFVLPARSYGKGDARTLSSMEKIYHVTL